MDDFLLLISLTMVPVLLAYVTYVIVCLFVPFKHAWKRVVPLGPIVIFGLYVAAGALSTSNLLPAVLLLATVESLIVVVIVLFKSYGRPMRFLSFSAAALSLLITLFVFGVAEDEFDRRSGDSPWGFLRVVESAPAEAGTEP